MKLARITKENKIPSESLEAVIHQKVFSTKLQVNIKIIIIMVF